MMDFEQLIVEFKENDSEVSSPLWIWFMKEEASATCKMCKTNVSRKDGSTGGLVYHLKRHHNFVSKYNAFKDFQELSEIKDKRMQARKRKNETSNDERPSKQQKITNCISTKYPSNHPPT